MVVEEWISFEGGGREIEGYLALPGGGRCPSSMGP